MQKCGRMQTKATNWFSPHCSSLCMHMPLKFCSSHQHMSLSNQSFNLDLHMCLAWPMKLKHEVSRGLKRVCVVGFALSCYFWNPLSRWRGQGSTGRWWKRERDLTQLSYYFSQLPHVLQINCKYRNKASPAELQSRITK